ncbi:MAG: hypothetical protein QOE90_1375 [Thermoplasmata archaeon]|jgi:hypothetical protein|nr:hypothetical protein [Thermoplasmata archaeon]
MRGYAVPLVLALLLATPAAEASWLLPVKVRVAPYHVGDALRYDTTERGSDGEVHHGSRVLRIDGPSHAVDAFGIDRATLDLHQEENRDGKLTSSVLCHVLSGGQDVVRADYAVGGYDWRYHQNGSGTGLGLPLLDRPATDFNETFDVAFGGDCGLPLTVASEVREGQRVQLHDLVPTPAPEGDVQSEPAVATTFHGRPALVIRYDLRALLAHEPQAGGLEGYTSVTLADGLPGLVAGDEEVREASSGKTASAEWALVGLEVGDDAPVAAGGATLPTRNPGGSFRPFERLRIDDAPFQLPYAYDEAFANLQADPQTGFSAWLRSHPDASLVMADYERTGGGNGAQDGEGAWMIALSDGQAARAWYTSRSGALMGLGASLPGAAKPASSESFPWSEPKRADPAAMPDLATTQLVRDAAQAQGLDVAHLQHIAFYAFQYGNFTSIGWNLADVSGTGASDAQGRVLQFDAKSGGATGVAEARRTADAGSLLARPIHGGLDARGSVASALAGPGLGTGLADGAALTGLALLLLAIKLLLVPLFTRLRRDALLDNPVRARLYERVRAEPGIHLAELVDFAAIGEGATRHHLDQLVKHRLLVRIEEEKFVRFFAAGEVPPEAARREAILRAGSLRAVYDLYAREPRIPLREAGARLGLSAPSVHRAKKKLEKAGLLPAAHEALVAQA